jgi:hypothetical protein
MSFSGMTSDQFNTHKDAITEKVASGLGKSADAVTLTIISRRERRRLNSNNIILKLKNKISKLIEGIIHVLLNAHLPQSLQKLIDVCEEN